MVSGLEQMKVEDLMVTGSRTWDMEQIRHIFLERDTELIISIPLRNRGSDDF